MVLKISLKRQIQLFNNIETIETILTKRPLSNINTLSRLGVTYASLFIQLNFSLDFHFEFNTRLNRLFLLS